MKSKFVAATILALAGLSSAGAFAQNAQYGEAALVVAPVASTSSLTRAQVSADYLQARRNGALAVSNEGAIAFAPAASSDVSRAEVHAQAILWAKAHQADGGNAG
jgi:hypothetical protein